ncbi:LysR substrate-binding domain-containing protein [Parafilimonas sp.]|jgi:LysR family hydrogen peroxide-inducible transcriptional activator|uniref:hydrogen peroxide-inducible genes activator n=1 Tax=Parafilimonas sp. TaxID=1969739 RepID=UPI003F7E9EA9
MTFTQLEYIVALDAHRHFAEAAAQCFITQPTLSMQVQKLEEELGVKIFDRSKQPVLPTDPGVEIIEHAKKILAERDALNEMINAKKDLVKGELKLGIIPTLAPYLLPLFIPSFTKKHEQIKLVINELTTSNIIANLRQGKIDAGILVTPLNETGVKEDVLFYEEMLAYVSKNNAVYKKTYLLPKDIDPDKLLLLQEGHCFRSQMVQLCELQKSKTHSHFEYEAGSFETLRRMVELNDGITILPELATLDMTAAQKNHLRYFKAPVPVREVSIVTHRNYSKRRLIDELKKEILLAVPDKLKKNRKVMVVPV